MDYDIKQVTAAEIDDFLPYIEGFMQDVAEYTDERVSVKDTLDGVENGRHTLWVMINKTNNQIDAYFTIHINQAPRIRILTCEQVGGVNIRHWAAQQVNFLREVAAKYECKRIEGYGRVGWERFLEPLGFKLKAVAVAIDL
jgi:hypothetical protein